MLDAWGEHAFTIHSVCGCECGRVCEWVCVGVSVGVYVSGCVYSTVVGCIILMLCGVYTDEAE